MKRIRYHDAWAKEWFHLFVYILPTVSFQWSSLLKNLGVSPRHGFSLNTFLLCLVSLITKDVTLCMLLWILRPAFMYSFHAWPQWCYWFARRNCVCLVGILHFLSPTLHLFVPGLFTLLAFAPTLNPPFNMRPGSCRPPCDTAAYSQEPPRRASASGRLLQCSPVLEGSKDFVKGPKNWLHCSRPPGWRHWRN